MHTAVAQCPMPSMSLLPPHHTGDDAPVSLPPHRSTDAKQSSLGLSNDLKVYFTIILVANSQLRFINPAFGLGLI